MKETFRYLLTVAVIVAITMEENESFDKCAMQKGQHCQQPIEVFLGSASFGVEPRELCSAFVKMIVCLRGVCVGNSYSFIQNIKKKHNIKCISSGADLKCDIDSCGITYLKTIKDHPDQRCCAADVFKVCVHKACRDVPIKDLINFDKEAMELYGITSCPKDTYDYSCIVDLKCDIELCRTSYLKTTKDHPKGHCRAVDAFTDCVHEACKDSPLKSFINITKRAMDLYGIKSCTKDKYYYSCMVDRKCDIDTCGARYLKTTTDYPEDRCRAVDAFKVCVHEACKDVFNIAKMAMELFVITSCAKEDTYGYLKSCIMDLNCNIETCGTIYLKTMMDHTDTRCGAADAFTACVNKVCRDSPNMSLIYYAKRAMDLFGITSCT